MHSSCYPSSECRGFSDFSNLEPDGLSTEIPAYSNTPGKPAIPIRGPEPHDLYYEDLIPLSKVPEHLPYRLSGKKLHISTIYRWASPRGLRGVRLETAQIGGSRYTSVEALMRFSSRITNQNKMQRIKTVARHRRDKKRAVQQIEQILRGRGISGRTGEPL